MAMYMVKVNTSEQKKYPHRNWVKMINSLSGFKSLNLLGSVNSCGEHNLSIVSSCVHLGSSPPLLAIVLRPHSESSPRHSLLNIKDQKIFTLNHVNQDIYKKAHQTSARYKQSLSEFKQCNLTPEFIDDFKAPFVKESHVKMAMSLDEVVEIKQNKTHLIIAKIENFYFPEGTLQHDGHIDIEKSGTLCGSGLDSYHNTERIARLSYAKPDLDVTEI